MSETPKHHTEQGNGNYETSDADFRNVMLAAAGLLGLMMFGLLLSWGAYELFYQHSEDPGAEPRTFTRPDVLPPGPVLQPDPHQELLVLRNAEDSVLTTYGWVEREAGIARVPISRAMELLLEKGLPVRSTR
jgi:hypothetical protein